jgi:hypothetical protein
MMMTGCGLVGFDSPRRLCATAHERGAWAIDRHQDHREPQGGMPVAVVGVAAGA